MALTVFDRCLFRPRRFFATCRDKGYAFARLMRSRQDFEASWPCSSWKSLLRRIRIAGTFMISAFVRPVKFASPIIS